MADTRLYLTPEAKTFLRDYLVRYAPATPGWRIIANGWTICRRHSDPDTIGFASGNRETGYFVSINHAREITIFDKENRNMIRSSEINFQCIVMELLRTVQQQHTAAAPISRQQYDAIIARGRYIAGPHGLLLSDANAIRLGNMLEDGEIQDSAHAHAISTAMLQAQVPSHSMRP